MSSLGLGDWLWSVLPLTLVITMNTPTCPWRPHRRCTYGLSAVGL